MRFFKGFVSHNSRMNFDGERAHDALQELPNGILPLQNVDNFFTNFADS